MKNTISEEKVNGSCSCRTIFRSNPEHGYTKISNAMLQDTRLSYESRGLLAELLSRPDDWEITVVSIVKGGGAGRDKVYRLFAELEKFGYARANQSRGDGGKFAKHQYNVTDDPKLLIERTASELDAILPLPEKPEAVQPLPEKPDTVIPFPEKPEAVRKSKTVGNSQYSPLTEKPEAANALADSPLPGLPFTANPTHTKERKKENNIYITTIEDGERESEREGGGLPSKVAAALAISIAAATTPCAATEPLSPPLQAIQIHDLKFESSWPSTAPTFAEPVKVAQQVSEFVEATEPAKTSTPAKPSAGTTRLSADWFLPKPWGQWAVHNCKRDAEWVRIQAAKFKKFWLSETDKKGFKKNWERTWQNWCRNALTSEAKHNGGRPFAKAEVGTEQFEVTQDSISGPGFVIDLKAVEMTATLAMCDPERARLIAEICARDWLANGQKPSSPMAVIKGAIIGDKNRGQQHDLRMQLEEQRGSGRSKTL